MESSDGTAADPGRIERLIEALGWGPRESLVLSLAVYATLASPVGAAGAGWMASALSRLGAPELAVDMAGVVFAFNAVNRVADARGVGLEYRLLRELRPLRGWMERRFATLTGLVYDLSYVHRPRRSPELVLAGLGAVFQRLGAPGVPDCLRRLERSPLVLEGISELILANASDAGVHTDLWTEAIAIAVACRAMHDSCLVPIADRCLSWASWPPPGTSLSRAASPGSASEPAIISACRRYAWQVSNAAYTVTDEQVQELHALGLSDAEILDLTLAVALFSALAIVEPLIMAADPVMIQRETEKMGWGDEE